MANRAPDWIEQAAQDLDHAEECVRLGRHEWACFAAQQGAEKAVKALHLHLGQEAWGHVIVTLLTDLPQGIDVPADLVERGRVLDNFYIPTRYPDSHPEGSPSSHYGPLQSTEAVAHARSIVEFARIHMA